MVRRCLELVVAGINGVNSLGGRVGWFLLSGIIIIMTYEVFMRYIVRDPTSWTLETAELLQVCLAFIAVGWVQQVEGHISVTVVTSRLREKARNWVFMIASFVMGIAGGLFTYLAFLSAQVSWEVMQRTEEMGILMYPFKVIMCLGFALLALQFWARGYKYYRLLRQ